MGGDVGIGVNIDVDDGVDDYMDVEVFVDMVWTSTSKTF